MEIENSRSVVHYSGRVQGVGFRFTVASLARSFPVSGYVKNLPDGRVYLEAEGQPVEVERFLAAIAAEFPVHIRNSQVESQLPPAGYSGFAVRY